MLVPIRIHLWHSREWSQHLGKAARCEEIQRLLKSGPSEEMWHRCPPARSVQGAEVSPASDKDLVSAKTAGQFMRPAVHMKNGPLYFCPLAGILMAD